MFLFLALINCFASLNKTVPPRGTLKFVEKLTEEDQQVVLYLSNLSKDPHLRYKITTPKNAKPASSSTSSDYFSEHEDSVPKKEDTFGDILKGVLNKTYSTPGVYTIQVHNSGTTPIEFSVSSHVYKKVNNSDKDVVELRNLLNSLQTAIEDLGNENYFLKNHQAKNIREAKFIRRSMNWLLAFPVITVAIGYFKYVLARQLVKPKGKRFKGLF